MHALEIIQKCTSWIILIIAVNFQDFLENFKYPLYTRKYINN